LLSKLLTQIYLHPITLSLSLCDKMLVHQSITKLLLVLNIWAVAAASAISERSDQVIKSEEEAQVLRRPELVNKMLVLQPQESQEPSLGQEIYPSNTDSIYYPWKGMDQYSCTNNSICGDCTKIQIMGSILDKDKNYNAEVYCVICSSGYPKITGSSYNGKFLRQDGLITTINIKNLCTWYSKTMLFFAILALLASCCAIVIYKLCTKKPNQSDIYSNTNQTGISTGNQI
jgi:hypothetical protein